MGARSVFGIGSKAGHEKPIPNNTPAPNALKRVLGGLLRRAPQAASAQVRDAEPKPQKAVSKPPRSAFEAGRLNADATLRSLRSGSTLAGEGQLLRKLRDSLVQIEAEIAKEHDSPRPDQGRLNGLKKLWAQDNDEMFAMMKDIRDRESKGLSADSALPHPPQVRSREEFNAAKGLAAVKPVDLDANGELKKMSELREKVELSLASATDGSQKRNLEELMSDIDRRVYQLTQNALGG